ncbi:MAG: low molecular weight protein-tyrosine-phosphatase [Candidatus Thiodiazotropha sp.]|nr:low molecular weight phosphotyrosine protein phosphatase [Candidatus Thiodiazotropha sp. (ex Lucina pensylvanica)]MBT3061413.1 low molecular weight phosphotyrosine protein phosphatase [Candidatus Thiodiazotropha sp. (ex Lucina pensylvanica)]MBV2095419.1 low molecular weight phosphotyrosine protein phosphatase [Candidatus Thiodiazotropha sp. (ex Codakia orbicularis)]PUB74808.1 MAG: phosphotyrosine protein phosphatase [gamma proteobacterium symbiont of Ctena orbiculata]PUB76906.1 MAG: phosphot
MSDNNKVSILFVCMGNICRSPTAQGVFRELVAQQGLSDYIATDSAGTIDYHSGSKPDRRARETAIKRGLDLSDLRARMVTAEDFELFDYVVAMDRSNYADLLALCPEGREERLHLFLDYAPQQPIREVPDPYYGGPAGFDRVFDLVEEASRGLLEKIVNSHFS